MSPQPVFNKDAMIDAVCKEFEVERIMLYEKCRQPNVKNARWVVWKIFMSHGYFSTEVGKMFGFDHSTVLHAMSFIDTDIEQMPLLAAKWEQVKHYMKTTPNLKVPRRKQTIG